jgi:hypothetical protein|tara:strand:+ start:1781 stop:2143 length:363 start_codon:yes stop_codon:yes gene_type:complete
MGFFDSVKKAASSVGRFIGSTGRGALRAVGDGARAVKSIAGKVNEATGGAAGMAWNAAKAHPTFGKLAMGIEGGLNAAIKGSDMGLKAIDIGERATKTKNFADAGSVYRDARSLAKQVRP